LKRCPTCNQVFEEEWLSFCTQDGTTLIESGPLPSDPPQKAKQSAAVETASPNEQATWNLPSGSESGGQLSDPPAVKPAWESPSSPVPPAPVWRPPPPPAYAVAPNKSLGIASMVLGIISITIGWMCFGPIPAIAAIILGSVSLSQIKKNPERVTGKQFAWVGVITGSLALVMFAGVMVFYVIAAIMSANQR
jgi:hypothetical protein